MCVGVRLPCLRQRTAASPNQTAEATGSGKKVSRTQTAAAFRLPSVNQSDDFSVQSVSSGRLSVTCLGKLNIFNLNILENHKFHYFFSRTRQSKCYPGRLSWR